MARTKKVKTLIPRGIPLEVLGALSEEQAGFLNSLGVNTVQEIAAIVGNDEVAEQMRESLGMSEEELEDLRKETHRLMPIARLRGGRKEKVEGPFMTGALPPPKTEFIAAIGLSPYVTIAHPVALPSSVDHRSEMPPVRDQGERGTCVAFASTAVREHLEIQVGAEQEKIDLSEQYLYWWCKEHDGIPPDQTPQGGTFLSVGFDGLEKSGIPEDKVWPYNPKPAHVDESGRFGPDPQGPPPPDAPKEAQMYRTIRTIKLNPTNVSDIKTCLADGKVVAFSIPVFNSWYQSAAVAQYGKITLPFPGETPAGGHAMAMVGYVDDEKSPGGGYFIIRNSWKGWGRDSVWGSGYGSIPYKYIEQYGQAAFSADRYSKSDVYIRDNPNDDGTVPVKGVYRNSPDIWLRHEPDGTDEHVAPAGGQKNYIHVRVFNKGPAVAYDVRAHVYVALASPAIWPEHWKEVGKITAEEITPDQPFVGSIPWEPRANVMYSFLVKVESDNDRIQHDWEVKWDNNIAQKNAITIEMPPGGEASFRFSLLGMHQHPITPDMSVDGGALPDGLALRFRLPVAIIDEADVSGGIVHRKNRLRSAWVEALEKKVVLRNLSIRKRGLARVWVRFRLPDTVEPGETYPLVFAEQLNDLSAGNLTCHIKVAPPKNGMKGWHDTGGGLRVKW